MKQTLKIGRWLWGLIAGLLISGMLSIESFAVPDSRLTVSDEMGSYRVSCGKASSLLSQSVRDYWQPEKNDSTVIIEVNQAKTIDGIYISWYAKPERFTLTAYDADGKSLKQYKEGELYDGISCFYSFPTATRLVRLDMPALSVSRYGIVYLQLSEAGKCGQAMLQWKAPADKTDLLVLPTHQDDEYIFLGGVIPYYLNKGYHVSVAFTANCGRLREEEALWGLWEAGIREYPDFLDFEDCGRKESIEEAANAWGGMEQVELALVRVLRLRRPEVVVTHDRNGENYHNSHKVTARAMCEAVKLAADAGYDPESVSAYGIWQVKKLYLHLWNENVIQLDYQQPLTGFNGRSALEVAASAYAYHVSQQEFYQVKSGGKYDNSLFGLYYSTVGYDTNDFFYGINKIEQPNPPITTDAEYPEQPIMTEPEVTTGSVMTEAAQTTQPDADSGQSTLDRPLTEVPATVQTDGMPPDKTDVSKPNEDLTSACAEGNERFSGKLSGVVAWIWLIPVIGLIGVSVLILVCRGKIK